MRDWSPAHGERGAQRSAREHAVAGTGLDVGDWHRTNQIHAAYFHRHVVMESVGRFKLTARSPHFN
jgi:hypothetical protein